MKDAYVLESNVRDEIAGDAGRRGEGGEPAAARAWAGRADLAGRRRDHRRGHLRHDRPRGGQGRRAGRRLLSYVVAGVGCALAAFCYAEFASMAPVAGSAYTYAYATLGELFAWIIGWDLILEYAMSCGDRRVGLVELSQQVAQGAAHSDRCPITCARSVLDTRARIMNLPAVLHPDGLHDDPRHRHPRKRRVQHGAGLLKLGVVLFVIVVGIGYVNSQNWIDIPVEGRKLPEQTLIPETGHDHAKLEHHLLEAAEDWSKEFVVDKRRPKKLEAETVDVKTNNAAARR